MPIQNAYSSLTASYNFTLKRLRLSLVVGKSGWNFFLGKSIFFPYIWLKENDEEKK